MDGTSSGILFYRFISENLTAYLNAQEREAGRPDFDYANLSDADAEFGKAESTERAYAAYRARHQQLVADGSIAIEGDSGILTRDIPFSSPSTAAAVALGRSSNGRIAWKSADGQSYGDWENRGVE